MKKLTFIVVAMFVAAMFTAPVFAEDRLSLSGSYFARGYMSSVEEDVAGTSTDTDTDFFTQRMRVQAVIAVADDVTATIRADLADAKWGSSFSGIGGGAARPGAETDGSFRSAIDIDRTYVTIDKEMWSLQAGQQYMGLGILEVLDVNATGLNFGLKFDPVTVNLLYSKVDEGDNTINDLTDEEALGTEDVDLYGVNVGFMLGEFDSNVFGAMTKDEQINDDQWVVGFMTSGALGVVNLVSELAVLGGDDGTAADGDATGLQFYLKADSNLNDMLNIGGEVLYAKGDDTDTQITTLGDWGTFTPMGSNTPMTGFASGLNWAPFDPSGEGAGVIGATVFVSATPVEKLSLGAKLGYFTTEEDDVVDGDVVAFNAWASYEIASNTKINLTYLMSKDEVDSVGNVATDYEEDEQLVVLGLAVSF
jgi:hypothetical protein